MKLFKKFWLWCWWRYGSLHADGMRQQQIVEGEGCLKDFDIKMDPAMVQDTEKMMGGFSSSLKRSPACSQAE